MISSKIKGKLKVSTLIYIMINKSRKNWAPKYMSWVDRQIITEKDARDFLKCCLLAEQKCHFFFAYRSQQALISGFFLFSVFFSCNNNTSLN